MQSDLIGRGLYTPAEASRLLNIPANKISRWLRGHNVQGKHYGRLWEPEINLGDDRVFLGFRDLMEARVVQAFIRQGISAIGMRSAIRVARDVINESHPLATNRFRTDGREIFLHVIETNEEGEERERLLNLFRRQYEFRGVIEPILKSVDFGREGNPLQWWPRGRRGGIVVDPERAFGAPIDDVSSVPVHILAETGRALGVAETAAAYLVSAASVRRAMDFDAAPGADLAA